MNEKQRRVPVAARTEPKSSMRRQDPTRRGIRRSFLPTVLAGAALLAMGVSPAQAACSYSSSVTTCTGAFSTTPFNAEATNPATTTLQVYGLSADIKPLLGTNGVVLISQQAAGATGEWRVGRDGDPGGDGATGKNLTVDYTGGSFAIRPVLGKGIIAISRGGNGGTGGDSLFDFFGVGNGGRGGNAGSGGSVTVNSSGAIVTWGVGAFGIMLQSLGGDGGTGGDAYTVSAKGGKGGNAASGGTVTLVSSSSITTEGKVAHGIFALSAGGAGGIGGDSGGIVGTGGQGGSTTAGGLVSVTNTGTIAVSGPGAYAISAQSVGGFGGGGGQGGGIVGYGTAGGAGSDGGDVIVRNGGRIQTSSQITVYDDSHAIFVQSIGGGGGAGGTGAGLVGLGASGAAGGKGGSVSVYNTNPTFFATTTTLGARSAGIFAQSVGGGGGDGGDSAGLVALGGGGSVTSPGGNVSVYNEQFISTNGISSPAIFAQSVGGGGGNGGLSFGAIAVGGKGGGGGDAGLVTFTGSVKSSTFGSFSPGLLAQSVGGGGGNGGGAFAGAVGTALSVAVGGSGAAGGKGGVVTVGASGAPVTTSINNRGFKSHGIQAQSVGGGGGNGGFAVSGTIGAGASVSLGGAGGPGGNASAVGVWESGRIQTSGDQAHGIFAQSVGGGGGDGGGSASAAISPGSSLAFALGGKGGAAGNAARVDVNASGSISTTGQLANGVFAQSVGGGGGNGGFSFAAGLGSVAASFALGGNGGGGGAGSDVVVRVTPDSSANRTIETSGDHSAGIFAQSVGGGGGNGGFTGTLAAGSGASAGLSMGGNGGEGGSAGGIVDVVNASDVKTHGMKAVGILAQSVGGGGGNGGFSLAGGGGTGASLSAAIGGSGGGGQNGGLVTLGNDGSITTDRALSYGLMAQSVGGGGGSGGYAFSASATMQVGDTPSLAAAVTLGGSGGAASHGGQVIVDNRGSIGTLGLNAHAIVAQSVGGGGGNGGWAGSVAMNSGNGGSLGFALGGTGGGGGNGGAVTLNSGVGVSGSELRTWADGASGLYAQSLGGGGGDGGFGFSGAFGLGGEKSVAASVAIGGGGAAGGTGGAVNVDNRSLIVTRGVHANGIFAQSIGGGGGNGGMAISGTLSLAAPVPGSKTFPVGVSVGGGAGNGSTGGNVVVSNSQAIYTYSRESFGILAQSIGGSGGNGGLAVTAQLTGAATNAATIGATIGGGGGTGNKAGVVDVTNNTGAAIVTSAFGSHGVFAQSVGGGGGTGGMSVVAQLGKAGGTPQLASKTLNASIGLGGAGGDGGAGNSVWVDNKGAIDVTGKTSVGIYAQSIGGGGGDGGGTISALGQVTDDTNGGSKALNASLAIGGGGGNGNDGGYVAVVNTGSIITRGGSGYGVFAQSVGGGGGIGGRANTLSYTSGCLTFALCSGPKADSANLSLSASIGGSGGGASNGGNVVLANAGVIETFGGTADGIYAQSVGGGGGNGGNGVIGEDGLVPDGVNYLLDFKDVVTFKPSELLDTLSVAVGGNQGSSGNGGALNVSNSKNITTHGSNSSGIYAQSVGGGGGVGGKGAIGLTGTLGIGGKGGAAGDGGRVDITNTNKAATIETFGAASNGIFAQSVGGGGGSSGNVDRAFTSDDPSLPSLNIGIGLAVGQGGGSGGHGGIVNISHDGAIVTHGNSAVGIFAQSVGGGGGLLGGLGNDLPVAKKVTTWAAGSNGDAGNAGAVTVVLGGRVATSGNNATGIFAQSAAGAGVAGPVTVTLNSATVKTAQVLDTRPGGDDLDASGQPLRGLGSVGILAQSVGNAAGNTNNGNIAITLNGTGASVVGGRSVAGGVTGVGIEVVDGRDNTIVNRGLVTTLGGVDAGYAIHATGSRPVADAASPTLAVQAGGNERVSNFGAITGSVDLGAGVNAFTNEPGALFNTGRIVDLGAGNLLTNSGSIRPGGSGRVMTTQLTGDLVQTELGVLDLDIGGRGLGLDYDQLLASGSMELGGTLSLHLLAGFAPVLGDQFRLFGGSFLDLAFTSYEFDGAVLAAGLRWETSALSTIGVLSVSAVPAPASVWLMLAGLTWIGAVRRRRSV